MAQITIQNLSGTPATPSSGFLTIYTDSADKHTKQIDENGTIIDLASSGGGGSPGGSAGSVQVNDGAGGFTGDNNFFYGSGLVGIGTNTPAFQVHLLSTSEAKWVMENTVGSGKQAKWMFGAGVGVGDGSFALRDELATTNRLTMDLSGNIGIGGSATTPTALMHLGTASTGSAGTAPLKVPAGTLLASTEQGAIESDGAHIYWTDSGGTRHQLD